MVATWIEGSPVHGWDLRGVHSMAATWEESSLSDLRGGQSMVATWEEFSLIKWLERNPVHGCVVATWDESSPWLRLEGSPVHGCNLRGVQFKWLERSQVHGCNLRGAQSMVATWEESMVATWGESSSWLRTRGVQNMVATWEESRLINNYSGGALILQMKEYISVQKSSFHPVFP